MPSAISAALGDGCSCASIFGAASAAAKSAAVIENKRIMKEVYSQRVPEIMERPMNVSIVIPAFNEEQGVAHVIGELRSVLNEHGIGAEILVIDDGSADGTAQAAAAAGARVFKHRSIRGYGAALKSGISAPAHLAILLTDAHG